MQLIESREARPYLPLVGKPHLLGPHLSTEPLEPRWKWMKGMLMRAVTRQFMPQLQHSRSAKQAAPAGRRLSPILPSDTKWRRVQESGFTFQHPGGGL